MAPGHLIEVHSQGLVCRTALQLLKKQGVNEQEVGQEHVVGFLFENRSPSLGTTVVCQSQQASVFNPHTLLNESN